MEQLGVVIPTYNARKYWPSLRKMLDQQGIAPQQILIIDSSSTDDTAVLAEDAGYQVIRIPQNEFSHGGTRQLGCDHFRGSDVLIYLTQDALPSDQDAFRTLYGIFADPDIGAACGRQLGMPGDIWTSSNERDFVSRSWIWHEGRSTHLSR